jgi:hypothetical protein
MPVRPVFIIGSTRSGTSILTWALGQHPNLLPIEETRWFEKFAADLRTTYLLGRQGPITQLESMGIESPDFFQAFGKAINDLILSHGRYDSAFVQSVDKDGPFQRYRSPDDPKTRWVDGTPEYSLYVYELLELFPQARFIHMLRDVRLVTSSLMQFDRAGSSARSLEAAYDEWYRFTRACLDAERAFGSQTVLRVRHADLVSDPEKAVRRCLEFLDESYNPACLEPLEHVINTSGPAPETITPEHAVDSIIAVAIGLNDELLAEPEPHYEPDSAVQGDLRARSSLAVAAYSLPIDGPVKQEGPATGLCEDLWIEGSLKVTVTALEDTRKLTLEGEVPAMTDLDDVTLFLTVDGKEFRASFAPGAVVSWDVFHEIQRDQPTEITLEPSRTTSPLKEGVSDDERELAFYFKRFIFSA